LTMKLRASSEEEPREGEADRSLLDSHPVSFLSTGGEASRGVLLLAGQLSSRRYPPPILPVHRRIFRDISDNQRLTTSDCQLATRNQRTANHRRIFRSN
jgi:hypothetical protein